MSTVGLASGGVARAEICRGSQVAYGTICETEKEHAEFQKFVNCPFDQREVTCSWAQVTHKERWPSRKAKEAWEQAHGRKPPELPSELHAGNVTVALGNPVTLRGGLVRLFWIEWMRLKVGWERERLEERERGVSFEEEEQHEEARERELERVERETGGIDVWVEAVGAPTLQPVSQRGPSLSKLVDAKLLPRAEGERFDYYTHVARETKTYVTVEQAVPSVIHVNLESEIAEAGTALELPVKVHLSSPFLGSQCYLGSDADPITVPLTTGTAGELRGKAGRGLAQDKHGFDLSLPTVTLVSNSFSAPGLEGCGVEGGADAAMNAALGLPSSTGNFAVLNGTLTIAGSETAQEGVEGKI